MLDDESLAGYFEGTDVAELREHQQASVTMVTGGPDDYDGQDMREALAAAGVADEDRGAVGRRRARRPDTGPVTG